MKKVVLNGCYGGFGVSTDGICEILRRKGYENTYIYSQVPYDERESCGYGYRKGNDGYTKYVTVKDYGETVDDIYELEYFDSDSFDRTDADLIAAIEEKGSEFMSDSYANLYVKEYDDENYYYAIDEYDGNETLELIPVVSEKKLLECKDVCDIIAYLRSLNIKLREIGVDI